MDRAGAITYLGGKYNKLATFAEIAQDDSPEGYGLELDAALRELGIAEGELATANITDKVKEFIALLEYFALKKINENLVLMVDTKLNNGQIDEKSSQFFTQTAQLLAKAEANCKAKGFLDTSEPYPSGWVNIDYIQG